MSFYIEAADADKALGDSYRETYNYLFIIMEIIEYKDGKLTVKLSKAEIEIIWIKVIRALSK